MSTEKLCGASVELAKGKNSLTPKYTVKHFLHTQKFPLKFCWVKESKKYIPENSTSDSVIALLDRCFVRSYTTVMRVIYETISKDYFYTPKYHPISTAFIHTIQYKKIRYAQVPLELYDYIRFADCATIIHPKLGVTC